MSSNPANWFPDPTNRHQMRYWDGANWTEHVSDNGITGVDPLQPKGLDRVEDALTFGKAHDPAKIAEQVGGTGYRGAGITGAAFQGSGTLFTEPILVVN